MCVQPRAGSRAGESLAVLGLRQHKSSKGHAEPAIDALIFAATGMPAVLAQVDSTTEALTDESKAVARAAMDRMCAAEAGVQCAADIHDVLEQRYTNGGPSEDDNFNPGTRHGATGGSPPPSLASFAQLFGYQPLPLTCIYLSVRAARLWCSIRTPLQPVRCAHARHRDLNRCFARCRLDAVLRQPHSLAYARLSEAVRLPLDQGISAGRRASCRHARTLVV